MSWAQLPRLGLSARLWRVQAHRQVAVVRHRPRQRRQPQEVREVWKEGVLLQWRRHCLPFSLYYKCALLFARLLPGKDTFGERPIAPLLITREAVWEIAQKLEASLHSSGGMFWYGNAPIKPNS